ncbi:MAG: hypothetical protein JXA36_07580 [Coriobacteriia bacterium]|nr:hypothetical protein [Coriobacteriia bacterium]
MKRDVRFYVAAAGVCAIALATVGEIVCLVTDCSILGYTGSGPVGWVATLVVVFAIAGVGWVLLGQRRANRGDSASLQRTRCTVCGHEILGQWRMCPYCGAMLRNDGTRAAVIGR